MWLNNIYCDDIRQPFFMQKLKDMEKKTSQFYQLRITTSLKYALEQLALRGVRSLADEIRRRIAESHAGVDQNLIVDHPEFFNGAKEIVSLRLPHPLHRELKELAEQNSSSINGEITKRLLLSDPLGDLNSNPYKIPTLSERDEKQGQVKEQEENQDKGLCPQTEDERILLEKYRQLTPDQRTQMQAIGDTFIKPIKRKNSG